MENNFKICQERLSSKVNLENVRCVICHEIPLFPSECLSCQNIFCKDCINAWKNVKNVCPLQCQGPFLYRPIHKTLKNTLMSLTFYCKNKEFGCETTDTLVNILLHEKKSCLFKNMICPNKKCKMHILKKFLDEHLKECPYQSVTCMICQQSYYKHVIDEHNCLFELKNNVKNLKFQNKILSENIKNLKLEAQALKSESAYDLNERLIKKYLNIYCKDIKHIIRKQITQETTNNKMDLLRLDPNNINITIINEEEPLANICCKKNENLKWIVRAIKKKCSQCSLTKQIRYQCSFCSKSFCTSCKGVCITKGYCQSNHKINFRKPKKTALNESTPMTCIFCNVNLYTFSEFWEDNICAFAVCGICYNKENGHEK